MKGFRFVLLLSAVLTFVSCSIKEKVPGITEFSGESKIAHTNTAQFNQIAVSQEWIETNLSDPSLWETLNHIPPVKNETLIVKKVIPLELPVKPALILVHSYDAVSVIVNGENPRVFTNKNYPLHGAINTVIIPLEAGSAGETVYIAGVQTSAEKSAAPGVIFGMGISPSGLLGQNIPKLQSIRISEKRWLLLPGDSPLDANGVPLWTYSTQENWAAETTEPKPEPGVQWLKKTLPPCDFHDPSLYFMTFFPAFEIYSGTNLIYSFGHVADKNTVLMHQLTHHTVRLPADYAVKPLFFRTAYDSQYETMLPGIELCPHSECVRKGEQTLNSIVQNGSFYIFAFTVFITLSVLFLMVYIIRARYREKIFLYISLFFCFFALNDLSSSFFLPIFFNTLPYYNNQIMAVTYLLTSPFLVAFYRELFGLGIWKRLLLVMVVVESLIAAVFIPLSILRELQTDMWLADQAIRAVEILLSIGAIFYYISHSARSYKKIILLVSLITMGFATSLNLMMNIKMIGENYILVDILLFVHFILLGIVMILNISETEGNFIRMRQELETAKRIQNSILPKKTPDIPGIEIQSRYIPMAGIAGDFYDYYSDDEGNLGAVVADVSGHGVPAALIASMVKVSFASKIGSIRNPEKVLKGMNDNLTGNVENQFITAGCLFLDSRNKLLSYSNAAHPALIVYRRSTNEIITLKPKGSIMGYFVNQEYLTETIPVQPGDRILLYTDGIIECSDAHGEEFGEDHLFRFLKFSDKMKADEFCNELIRTLEHWKEKRVGFDDDITLVLIDIHF
ncbi:MAG: hypothetical protein A2Y33_11005 [Spirochaetes bacterium GWF1_51_8]|nr:MAG: hypothetical protein A2Y33_11005 [Spirochaetes bacterium GWF1_51_8]